MLQHQFVVKNFIILSFSPPKKKKSYKKVIRMDFKKKLLYKMLVKYYLSDNIKVSFENFDLSL